MVQRSPARSKRILRLREGWRAL